MISRSLLLTFLSLWFIGTVAYADLGKLKSVKFVSTSYANKETSPYQRSHDIVQYAVQFADSGFTTADVVGTLGSPSLPEYPCSDEENLCWISMLPRLVAVYPRSCLPECGSWEAYGFHFEQRYPYHLVLSGKLERVILYEVTSPGGEVQIQLVSANFGIVGFTDFYGEARTGLEPVLLRAELASGQLFPFEPTRAVQRDYKDEEFLDYFGIKWSEAVKRNRITRHTTLD